MLSEDDADVSDDEELKRHNRHRHESSNKRRKTQMESHKSDIGEISHATLGGDLVPPRHAMSLSQFANLFPSSTGSTATLPSPSFGDSLSKLYFGNFIDQRIFENAQQQLRQGVDITRIANLFQSPAIPAGNTEFAFTPSISIPIARSMLNANQATANPSSLSMGFPALNSSSHSMNPLLSAVAMLQEAQSNQRLIDPLVAQRAQWTQSLQPSVDHAVQSALANLTAYAEQQEQQRMQDISLAQELLQRFPVSTGQPASAATHNYNDALVLPPKTKPAPSYKTEEGVVLAIPEDRCKLNDQQVFLRLQIEAYRANEDDMSSHTRGRNKPVVVGQVGIRCKHCCHLQASRRGKGSTYFPSTLMGIYQAAQNMSVEHLQSGICAEMPPDVKSRFLSFGLTKPGASVAGKRYWAEAGKRIGLVDTDSGIRFAKDEDKAVKESALNTATA